jgi:hypothetical protein
MANILITVIHTPDEFGNTTETVSTGSTFTAAVAAAITAGGFFVTDKNLGIQRFIPLAQITSVVAGTP